MTAGLDWIRGLSQGVGRNKRMNKQTSDGLHPMSDGLQPTSDGLYRSSDGLQPTTSSDDQAKQNKLTKHQMVGEFRG